MAKTAMPDTIIESPIINPPFREPDRHWRFIHEGITNDIVETRRASAYSVPNCPRKKKRANHLSWMPESGWPFSMRPIPPEGVEAPEETLPKFCTAYDSKGWRWVSTVHDTTQTRLTRKTSKSDCDGAFRASE